MSTRWQSFTHAYKTRRAVRWTVEGVLLLALITVIGAWQTRRHLSGVPPPTFTLPALNGGTVSSASLSGKPTMLVLWAPWCGVCKAQADNVQRVHRWAGAGANVVTIAFAYKDQADVVRVANEEGTQTPVLLGTDTLSEALKVEAFPTVYFLDEAGRIKRSAAGYTTTLGMLWRLWL
jgi:thiol-disulfide isomerase/thioredoxin